jgi:16S rRNA (guanine(966)-N(2))-methyltransferase RsmD
LQHLQSLNLSKPLSSKASKTNQVRINAGVWRSRLLKFPDVEGLRPTPERVRQTVFNWLGQDLTGKTCLDLFAGTGAFGFEALSRNAKNVVMVENSVLAYQSLMQNQQLLDAKNSHILRQDVLAFLSQNTQLFDVVFCDPPYHKAWLEKILPSLNQHLSPSGLLYIEAEFSLELRDLLSGWQLVKQNKAGNVYYHLLKSV